MLNALSNGEIKGLADLLPADVLEANEQESVSNLSSVVVRQIIEGCHDENQQLPSSDFEAIWQILLESSIDNLKNENGMKSEGQKSISDLLFQPDTSREELDKLRKTSRNLHQESKLPLHLCLMSASIAKGIETFGDDFTSIDFSNLVGPFQSFAEADYVDKKTKSLFVKSIETISK